MQKTALLVDDSRVARITLKRLLIANGFKVIESESGEHAIQYLDNNSDALPDIVFMDVMMPGVDGYTATEIIKSNPLTASLPIVICTGNETAEDMSHGLSSGAMAILSKPPAEDKLQAILDKFSDENPLTEDDQPAQQNKLDEEKIVNRVSEMVLVSVMSKVHSKFDGLTNKVDKLMTPEAIQHLISQYMNTGLETLQDKLQDKITAAQTASDAHATATVNRVVDKRLSDNAENEKQYVSVQLVSMENRVTSLMTNEQEKHAKVVDKKLAALSEQLKAIPDYESTVTALTAQVKRLKVAVIVTGVVAVSAIALSLVSGGII